MLKSVVLDICKSASPPVQTIVLRQGELESTILNIGIFEDGEAFDLEGYEARFMAALPGGKVIIDPCEKTGANTVSYTLPAAMTAQAGSITLAYVAIVKDEEWIAATDCMGFSILRGIDITAEVAKDILGNFTILKRQLDELVANAIKQTEGQQTAWENQMQEQANAFEEAEAQRDEQEAQRVSAETKRASAESARASAESSRVTAESSRASADSARASAEQARANAENARVTAESKRVTAESTRATAESSRESAESARATAENARKTAENGRVAAENARVAAETKREETIADALANIQNHTSITNAEIDALWGD